jgi:hypothetical protein
MNSHDLRLIRLQLWLEAPWCVYCRRPLLRFARSTLDHVVAKCWGGPDRRENLVLACKQCNRLKDNDPATLFARAYRPQTLPFVFDVPRSLFSEVAAMSSAKVSFNYQALEAGARETARENATQIRQTLERTAAGIVDVGKRLLRVREALSPEQYKAWLFSEFQWNLQCATTYETIATKFGDLACIERFHPSALYALARSNIDPRVVKEAIKRAERGDQITRPVVVKLMLKFAPPIETRLAGSAVPGGIPPARGPLSPAAAAIAAINVTVSTFRTFMKRLDVTVIPNDQRIALANELFELALQVRTGRMADKSASAPAETEPAPRSRGDRRELARA